MVYHLMGQTLLEAAQAMTFDHNNPASKRDIRQLSDVYLHTASNILTSS